MTPNQKKMAAAFTTFCALASLGVIIYGFIELSKVPTENECVASGGTERSCKAMFKDRESLIFYMQFPLMLFTLLSCKLTCKECPDTDSPRLSANAQSLLSAPQQSTDNSVSTAPIVVADDYGTITGFVTSNSSSSLQQN